MKIGCFFYFEERKGDNMAVFKIEKNKNYTIMSNYHLRDKNLSLKAKGLLSFMLSLPDDWDYSLNGLCAICKEQETAIKSTLKELKITGYLVIEKVRGDKGYFEYVYNIYEQPVEIIQEKNPEVENPSMDNPPLETDTQINIKEQITKEQIDKNDKTILNDFNNLNLEFFDSKSHNILTNELISRKYISNDDLQIVYYDNLFNDLIKKYNFSDLVVITHYIIPRVVSRNFVDENDNPIKNKFGYFKSAILNNIDKLINNEIEWDEELGWFREKNEIVEDIEEDIDYDLDF